MPDIRIEGTGGAGDGAFYVFTIDGSATKGGDMGREDVIEGQADGTVLVAGEVISGGEDNFSYTGCIMDFEYSGAEPIIYRDGSVVQPDNVTECPPTLQSSWLWVAGTGIGSPTVDFEITVDGGVNKTGSFGHATSVIDNNDGTQSVSGSVEGRDYDVFGYTGCIQDATFSGSELEVARNGSFVSRTDVVECPADGGGDPGNGGNGGGGNGDGGGDMGDQTMLFYGSLGVAALILIYAFAT